MLVQQWLVDLKQRVLKPDHTLWQGQSKQVWQKLSLLAHDKPVKKVLHSLKKSPLAKQRKRSVLHKW